MKSILSRVKFNKKQMTVMIALSVLACVTNIISTNIAAKLTTRFAADLRKEVFYKVQDFSAVEIDQFSSASLITRNTTDVTMIQSFLAIIKASLKYSYFSLGDLNHT